MSEPLGLFPLPLVLVPTERIPLHIFEDRYRELIGECLEEGTEFGFVLATGDGAVHEIGTRAWVAEVLDELDDGRMNIVVEGRDRFRLLELTSGRSFTTGLVEAVVDEDEPARPRTPSRRWRCSAPSSSSRTPTSTCPGRIPRSSTSSWPPASTSASTPSRSCSRRPHRRARMERLVALLEQAIELLRIEQTMRERASRNGKITHADHGSGSDGT